jgi:hypothetical protein
MKKLRLSLFLFLTIAFQTLGTLDAKANQGFEFQVYPQLSEKNKSKEYYHINVTPGKTYAFPAIVKNDSDDTLHLDARSVNAFSKSDGIFYQTESRPSFSILEPSYKLTNYMANEKKITLKPFEEKLITFTVKVPNDIEGTLLGAIQFRTLKETNKINSGGKDAQLFIDKYMAKNFAIQLDLTSPQEVELKFPKVVLDPKKAQLQLSVENNSPRIVDEIKGNYRVLDENHNLLFKGTLQPWKMAPKTQFDYRIPWDARTLKPGSYFLKLDAHVNGKKVNVKRSFNIKNEHLRQIQKDQVAASQTTIDIMTSQPSWVKWLVGLNVLFILIVSMVLYKIKGKFSKVQSPK